MLLRKGVCPYEYIDSWERFNEATLPNKKAFYSKLSLQDITDEDYLHTQKVFEEFKLKNLGKYHDLYVQSDTLLLVDVFENFRNKCVEIYKLDLLIFVICTWISMASLFFKKKTRIKLELLTDNDMLMMFEKGIKGVTCHAGHRYAKTNNKYMSI